MSDAAFWAADKGWGSSKRLGFENWTGDDWGAGLEDDEELARELALDEAEDRKQ